MKKFLLMAALVAFAAWLVHHRLFPLWDKEKPAPVAKKTDAPPPPTDPKKDPPRPAPLTDGLALAAEGKCAEALPLLVREIDELDRKGSPDAARHMAALARCYDAVGSADKAAEAWNRLLKRYPEVPERAEAHYWLAKNAVDQAERNKHLDQARACPGDSEGKRKAEAEIALALADQEGKEFEARAELSRVLRAGLPKEKAAVVKERIVELNKKLLWSKRKTPDSIEYVVKSGDTLTQIAQRHKTTVGLIMRINRLANARIREGDIFKLYNCEGCQLIVRKTELTLQLWWKDVFVKEYDVCIGDPEVSPTPEGDHVIKSRIENPPWKDIPAGDPRNILGTRWMGFEKLSSYGVHGTTQPETVPGKKSAGCVRMLNADVEEVYDFAITGTRVTILP